MMRSTRWLFYGLTCCLLPTLFRAEGLAREEAASPPSYFAAGLQTVGMPVTLKLQPGGRPPRTWLVHWGDGSESREAGAANAATHTYTNPGYYALSVEALEAEGKTRGAELNYDELQAEDGVLPVVDKPKAQTLDQFSAEQWVGVWGDGVPLPLLRPQQAGDPQLEQLGGVLTFDPGSGTRFSQALPHGLHHVCVVYDRAPLFLFSATVRFYVDGLLASEQRSEAADPGPVRLGTVTTYPALRLYARCLPPHRVAMRMQRESLGLTVAPPCVEPFTVEAPRITQTTRVPLDPDPAVDNAKALRAALRDAKPGTRLQLINQTTGQPGGRFSMHSLDSGNDWTVFRIFDKEDLELDGGGAELIFTTNCRQFWIRNCRRVSCHDFSVDLDQTKYRVGVYARILSLDPATGDVRFQFVRGCELAPDRTVPGDIAMWRWRPHDPKTFRLTEGPYFKTGEAFEGKPSRDPADPSILIAKLKPGQIAALEKYRQGKNFLMLNNARFQNTSMSISGGEQITLERLNFYATLGMVVLTDNFHHLRVAGCRIGLPPGETVADRPLAAGADGFHFHDTQGYVLFEHNEIALTDDDPITIKDGVYRDLKAIDAQTVTLAAKPGDEFAFYRWDFSPLQAKARVVEVKDGQARLESPLPADLPKSFLGLNLKHHTTHWILRDNSLHDYYGRLLLCTAHGLITGNTIQGSWLHLGASNASFDNAGISSQVTVFGNLLVHTEADTGIWGAESKYPVFQQITYAGNSFTGKGLTLRNAGASLVAGNYFEAKAPAIGVTRSTGVTVSGNTALGDAKGKMEIQIKESEGVTETENVIVARPDFSAAPAKPN